MTAINVSVALLAWFICTCGSDQMAIQRYRATGGIAAARRSFGVSLIATFLVKVLLAIVGLAVMAYFIDQPQLLPDQTTVHSSPDHVFPRFIVVGIPRGLTGLVIAGMLAAAMSSLSSGISASASVISDDFVRRFRGLPADETAKLAEERWISIAVGIVAVGLSLGVDYVPGNLFEITTRAVNALVAPLFILFFMAIFVPWANSFGTIVGLIVSIVVAVAISLFEVWQISMMWIVPGSMFAGIAAGCLASLVPIGVRRR
jgi:Na+/proline symporter